MSDCHSKDQSCVTPANDLRLPGLDVVPRPRHCKARSVSKADMLLSTNDSWKTACGDIVIAVLMLTSIRDVDASADQIR